MHSLVKSLLTKDNSPGGGQLTFNSSDHIRYQNDIDISGHNYNCNRRIVIQKNISGNLGYTVSIYNLDGIHPVWHDNLQMAPKQMKIISVDENTVHLRGYGYDPIGASFADYGISFLIENGEITRAQLNMFDRGISLLYLK